MDSGALCLLLGVVLFGGLAGLAVAGWLLSRIRLLDARVKVLDAAGAEAGARLTALAAQVERQRAELIAAGLRGERIEPAADVTAAVQAAARAEEPAAAPALPAVRRPVVQAVRLGVDAIDEADVARALGETARPATAPAAASGATPAASPAGTPAAAPAAASGATPAALPAAAASPAPAAPRRLPGVETLAVWFAASFGGLIAVVGVLLGLREAIAAGWFGPALRFAGGVSIALAAWGFSALLRWRRFAVPADALAGVGTAIAYGALWAGHARYGLYAQPVAFGCMAAVTAVSLFGAARANAGLWALLAAAGGYATPVLLSTGENAAVAFFAYLGVLNAGIVAAARSRGWWWLLGLAGVATAALHIGWGLTYRAPDQVAVALIAAAGLAVVSLAGAWRASGAASSAAAWVGAVAILVAGLAFVLPADPFHADPRTGAPLTWTPGPTAAYGAAYLAVIAALLGGVAGNGRSDGHRLSRWVGGAVVGLGLAAHGLGWGFAASPRWVEVVAAAVVVMAVAMVAARARGVALLAGPVLAAGLVLAAAQGFGEAGGGVLLALSATVTAGALAWAWGGGWQGPVAMAAAVLPLAVGLDARLQPFLPDGAYVTLAAVVAFEAFAAALALRMQPGRPGAAAAVVLAGPAAFLVFDPLWKAGIGVAEGALALGLALHVGLAARVAVRRGVAEGSGWMAALLVVGLGFLALAVPLELERSALTVGWAVEVAALAGLARRYPHPALRVFMGGLAVAVCVRLLVNPDVLRYGSGEGWIVLNWTLYTWGVPAAAMFVAAALLPGPQWGRTALRVAGTLLAFALVNVEVAHAFAHDGALSFQSENLVESMTRSISWGVFGLAVMGVGLVRDSRPARLSGFGFALLAAAKVCLIDVVSLPGWIRIGSLFGLAVVLLIASVVFMKVVLRDRRRSGEQE